jgi:hypothetical protein
LRAAATPTLRALNPPPYGLWLGKPEKAVAPKSRSDEGGRPRRP